MNQHHNRWIAVAAAFFIVLMTLSPSGAQVTDEKKYANCMELARKDPEKAFDAATAWQNLGGDEPARHCAAVALFHIGHFAEAAKRFEMLAINSGLDATLRAEVMAQAGQAWLQAGMPDKAEGAFSDAIVIIPKDPSVWIDRSVVRAGVGDYDGAILDLSQALRLAPGRIDALTLRAAAYRQTGRLEAAAEDANLALEKEPGNPEALLERGAIRRTRGDTNGARQDWIEVLRITPNSPTGETARQNIEKMDIKIQ